MARAALRTYSMFFFIKVFLTFQVAFGSVAILPNPYNDPEACGQESSGPICDPDHFLGAPSSDVSMWLDTLRREPLVACPIGPKTEGIEIAVAVVRDMGLSLDPSDPDNRRIFNAAAEKAARDLHDAWGVGDPDCGNNGVLIFLSIRDRSVYISHGAAFDGGILSWNRLQSIIAAMRPACRQEDYAEAVEVALKGVRDFVVKGPPSILEVLYYNMFYGVSIIFFFGIVGCAIGAGLRDKWSKRQYDEARDRLSDLERHRAEALAGRYQQTSCPICLENFRTMPHKEKEPSTTVDDTPVHLLGQPVIGSDGRPCRMLRCGHLFDESCFQEWIRTNPATATRCPVCRQDTRGTGSDTPPDLRSRRPRGFGFLPGRGRLNWEMYQPELEFRLRRLRHRYPSYIDDSAVDRWVQPSFQGGFIQDPAFTARDPSLRVKPSLPVRTTQRPTNSSWSDSTGYASFGGGTSSGGGGGGW